MTLLTKMVIHLTQNHGNILILFIFFILHRRYIPSDNLPGVITFIETHLRSVCDPSLLTKMVIHLTQHLGNILVLFVFFILHRCHIPNDNLPGVITFTETHLRSVCDPFLLTKMVIHLTQHLGNILILLVFLILHRCHIPNDNLPGVITYMETHLRSVCDPSLLTKMVIHLTQHLGNILVLFVLFILHRRHIPNDNLPRVITFMETHLRSVCDPSLLTKMVIHLTQHLGNILVLFVFFILHRRHIPNDDLPRVITFIGTAVNI